MARKKVVNVTIKDEELTPTTLGVYSNKTKNPLGLIILLAAFIAIAIYLPNIQTYFNKLTGNVEEEKTNNSGNNGDNGGGEVVIDDDKDKKFSMTTNDNIDTEIYTLSNITLNGTTFSFDITNKKTEGLNLSTYFLEFYSEEGTLISRVKVSSETIAPSVTRKYSYTVSPSASLFTFVSKTEDDYPQVNLNYNENGEATLVCTLGIDTYKYIFVDDSLSKITYLYTGTNNGDASYYQSYQDYQSKALTYSQIAGVTANVTDLGNAFSFSYTADLVNTNISNLSDENLYEAKTSPKVVKFNEEAKGFSCKQE